jgi:AraC-like DNA-binding protein
MMEPAVVRTTSYESSDAAAIGQFLNDAYGTSMRIRGSSGAGLLRHRRTEAGRFALESSDQGADLEFQVEPLHKIVVTRTVTSQVERGSDDAFGRYEDGQLFLMSSPELPYRARRTPGEVANCVIDPSLLAGVADSAPARRPQPIRFTRLDPLSPSAAARWWATRTYVAGLLASVEGAAAALLVASAAHLLAVATLATFPNTALTDPTVEDRHDSHPETLRRAMSFIEEHAEQEVTVADIAAAAHVTVRAVQLAFRRHRGLTPLEYLRQVRLDHAHHDLVAADPGRQTVTAIAYRWGFPSSSRFSRYYREAYGVSPSRTLRS